MYGALACTAYTLLAGAILLTPWLPGALVSPLVSLGGASRGTLPAVLVLGVFPAALGYATWTFALGFFRRGTRGKFSLSDAGDCNRVVDLAHGRASSHRDVMRRPDSNTGVVIVAMRGRQ